MAPLPVGHGESGVAVLGRRIYILGGRSHDRGKCAKYVHVYDTDSDDWSTSVGLRQRVSGLAACVVLMPPSLLAKASSWAHHSAAWWEDADEDTVEESSDE